MSSSIQETPDLSIQAGATFTVQFRYKNADLTPIDLTGFTAQMQIRRNVASPTVELEVTPTITSAAGLVDVTISADQTALLTARNYVYGVELHSASQVIRLIDGVVHVSPEVVR